MSLLARAWEAKAVPMSDQEPYLLNWEMVRIRKACLMLRPICG